MSPECGETSARMDLQEQTDERCTLLHQTPPPCRSPPRIDIASGLSSLCARARLCPRMGRRLVSDRRWPSLPRLRKSMYPEGPPWQLPYHRTVEAARYGADDLSPRTVRAACAQPLARCAPHHARLLSLQRVPLPCMAIRSTWELALDFAIGGFSPPEGRLARGFKPPAFSRFLFQSTVKSAESF